MKPYFEAHVTMSGDPEKLAPLVKVTGWKFSAIDGDVNLGYGVKCYATRQFNIKIGNSAATKLLLSEADILKANGATVLRRKIEVVIFDDRSKDVQNLCNGACPECVS